MAASEGQEAKKVIKAALAADVTLQGLLGGAVNPRIYADEAPQGSTFPYVLFGNASPGSHNNGLGVVRISTDPVFEVKVVVRGQPDANARTAQTRIDAVLQNIVRTVSGGWVFSSRGLEEVDRPEWDAANNRHHHLGYRFRFSISAA